VKHESKKNYHGRDILFSGGQRILTPYEQNIAKGVRRLDKAPTSELVGDIKKTLEATGKSPKVILQEVLDNRIGGGRKDTASAAAPAPVTKVSQPVVRTKGEEKAAPLVGKDLLSATNKMINSGVYSPEEWAKRAGYVLKNGRGDTKAFQQATDAAEAEKKANRAKPKPKPKSQSGGGASGGQTTKAESADKPAQPEQKKATSPSASGQGGKTPKVESKKNLTPDQEDEVKYAAEETNYRIKKHSEGVETFQKLSPNQKAALALYGEDDTEYYLAVNQLLRTGQLKYPDPERVKMAEFISNNLRSGLESLPPARVEEIQRTVTGRGVGDLGQLKVGDVLEDKGFGSYTDQGSRVLNQFVSIDKPNAIVKVKNPATARRVAPVMEYEQEGEHIALPGTKYRLLSVEEKGFTSSRLKSGPIPVYTFEEVTE
jgi:hypothetical protein